MTYVLPGAMKWVMKVSSLIPPVSMKPFSGSPMPSPRLSCSLPSALQTSIRNDSLKFNTDQMLSSLIRNMLIMIKNSNANHVNDDHVDHQCASPDKTLPGVDLSSRKGQVKVFSVMAKLFFLAALVALHFTPISHSVSFH